MTASNADAELVHSGIRIFIPRKLEITSAGNTAVPSSVRARIASVCSLATLAK